MHWRESSPDILFSADMHATGDGILTSLMVMEACIDKKATLVNLAEENEDLSAASAQCACADKKTALDNAEVQAAVEEAAEALGDDGRILVRESGTEPVIRVMVEAVTRSVRSM